MQFDASTIFVLALVVGIALLLAWAEINSRHQPRATGSDGAGAVPATPAAPVRSERNRQ